ncbi:DUF3347 domain-containing protein [Fulvivirga aurantia]|uniref:DUF3347 domain-containing protein n=1 Tax=Fulvivirga aurantia TaxID=2529383 RepID=UPI0016293B2B|nr:DUF3347 domain-containing protein [Fulvivirga aurantia]
MKYFYIILVLAFSIAACDSKKHNDSAEATHHDTEHAREDNDNSHTTDDSDATSQYASINEDEASNLLDAYLSLKDALVQSSSELAQNAAKEITKVVEGSSESQLLSGLMKDANQIAQTDEMEKIRTHFEDLSQHIYKMVKAKDTGKTVYKQYCPMAFDNEGAFWLSSEEEIKNPYFGDRMLRCGKVQETLSSK